MAQETGVSQTCDYCGARGVVGEGLEIRRPQPEKDCVIACKDKDACDARDALAHPETSGSGETRWTG